MFMYVSLASFSFLFISFPISFSQIQPTMPLFGRSSDGERKLLWVFTLTDKSWENRILHVGKQMLQRRCGLN